MAGATQFETGKTYTTRSIGDHNCIIAVTVFKRTARTITTRNPLGTDNKTFRIGSYTIDGAEFIKPWGSYSMAPIITARDAVSKADPLMILIMSARVTITDTHH